MCDACLSVDVRRMVWEMGAAVRGRWPLMLRTGWVVVRRITWVSPTGGVVTLPGKLPTTNP